MGLGFRGMDMCREVWDLNFGRSLRQTRTESQKSPRNRASYGSSCLFGEFGVHGFLGGSWVAICRQSNSLNGAVRGSRCSYPTHHLCIATHELAIRCFK